MLFSIITFDVSLDSIKSEFVLYDTILSYASNQKKIAHNFSHITYENHVLSARAKFIYQFYPFSADFGSFV